MSDSRWVKIFCGCLLLGGILQAHPCEALSNNVVINSDLAKHIADLKTNGGYTSEDFNACQITWTIQPSSNPSPDDSSSLNEITFLYENHVALKLKSQEGDNIKNLSGLGINCLEFNNYVYLFLDSFNAQARENFLLQDFSYVTYSSNQGNSWSELKSLHDFSVKAKFILPYEKFTKYIKIFGNSKNHVLSIFNYLDETTYLLDADLKILKTLPVYNRLTDFDYPSDFYWHQNVLYLMRGSCENVRNRIQCPPRTYFETSNDFGKTWTREILPFIEKSFFLPLGGTLYQFYSEPCHDSWLGLIPAFNHRYTCGLIQARMLDEGGKWKKPKMIIRTAAAFLGIYGTKKPILVWQDYRFHRNRLCSFIPIMGCMDASPVEGPTVTFAGELDPSTLKIDESIIEYTE